MCDAATLSGPRRVLVEHQNITATRRLRLKETAIVVHLHHSENPSIEVERSFRVFHRQRDMGQAVGFNHLFRNVLPFCGSNLQCLDLDLELTRSTSSTSCVLAPLSSSSS